MTSSVQPSRRIASNLLWSPATGLVRHPLAELSAAGRLLSIVSCPEPDRQAATEFYAGLLVPDFPAEYRAAFERLRRAERPLPELLPAVVHPGGILVLFAGLDYATLRLTPHTTIRKI
ncbi:cytosine deaminase [Alistipes sp.]|uniref:cytosine deaminase n=1 Tax=Alistipes sp. TaxID=1872444 RepID=UPI0025C33DA7|nr:cytosine deaminase [Alistipes sp.]